jgi:hypothetical protein
LKNTRLEKFELESLKNLLFFLKNLNEETWETPLFLNFKQKLLKNLKKLEANFFLTFQETSKTFDKLLKKLEKLFKNL